MKQFQSSIFAGAAMFAGIFGAASASAQSDCQPEFLESAQTITVSGIKVSAGASTSQNSQIRIRNAGATGAACETTLRIARLSTSPSANAIDFTLRVRGQLLDILPNDLVPGTAASDLSIPRVPTGPNGLALPLQLTVPSGWGLSSGSQVNDLVAYLVDAQGVIVDSLFLTVALNVPPAVEVRFVGVTGQNALASINLGILDPQSVNTSDPFGVRIWSTSPYTVSFRSMNDGDLVHTNMDDTIGYQFFMDGQRVSLNGAPAAQVARGTTAFGDLHPTLVRVEPFRARAGNYSDRVEVTVTAN